MIKSLRKYYISSGELFIDYDKRQEEIYRKAMDELTTEAKRRQYKQHTPEIRKLRDKIQAKYRTKEGLQLDLMSCCKNPNWNNFSAMLVKHWFQDQGFNVLVSDEDYNVLFERKNRYKSDGFSVICNIFGQHKIEALMEKASQNGGDPDLFVYLDPNPKTSWFVEVKKMIPNECLTPMQRKHFPLIADSLCPVEIARILPYIVVE